MQAEAARSCLFQASHQQHTVKYVNIAYAFPWPEGVGVHQLVPIMHVNANSPFQDDEDAAAAVIACLEQGLIGLHHNLGQRRCCLGGTQLLLGM